MAGVEISSRDYWVKVVEFLQQNWALIEGGLENSCTVYFLSDTSGVFDRLSFESVNEAQQALMRNGFRRFANDREFGKIMTPPQPPFEEREHPSGPIYSSGRYWR
jgi:hypothetical protein